MASQPIYEVEYVHISGSPVGQIEIDGEPYLIRCELVNALGVPGSWVEKPCDTVFADIGTVEKRQIVPKNSLEHIVKCVHKRQRKEEEREQATERRIDEAKRIAARARLTESHFSDEYEEDGFVVPDDEAECDDVSDGPPSEDNSSDDSSEQSDNIVLYDELEKNTSGSDSSLGLQPNKRRRLISSV